VEFSGQLTFKPMGRYGMNSNGPGAAFDGRSTARTSRERWLVMLGGVLAGLVAFGIGEATYGIFRTVLVQQNLQGTIIWVPSLATNSAAVAKNGALAFGALGACLGLCLGVAGGLARRSTPAAVRGGLLGAVLGSAAGAGLSLPLLPWFYQAEKDYFEYELILSLSMHAFIWGVLGAVAGLAFAVGRGEGRLIGRALPAGGLGGLLGAITFDLIGAMFFAAAETGEPISETWQTRLMARLMVTMGTAAVILLFLPDPPEDVVGRPIDLVATPAETSAQNLPEGHDIAGP
jgi:hypothetical protein